MSEVEIDQVIDPEGRLVSRLDATAAVEKKRDIDEDADIFDNEEATPIPIVAATTKKQKTTTTTTKPCGRCDIDEAGWDCAGPDDKEEEEKAGEEKEPEDAVKHTLY